MTRRTAQIELVAGALALAVAGIHLYWGIPRFTVYASLGRMPDPRPLAFVLSGHAILIGLTLAAAGRLDGARLYLPGMALVIVHLASYVAWHTVLRHGGASAGTHHGHRHAAAAVAVVGEHLLHSPLALAAKGFEVALLLCLAILYVHSDRSTA